MPVRALLPQLLLIQIRVVALARQQFVVRAALDDLPSFSTTICRRRAPWTCGGRSECGAAAHHARNCPRIFSSVCVSTAERESSRIRIRDRGQSRERCGALFLPPESVMRARLPSFRISSRSLNVAMQAGDFRGFLNLNWIVRRHAERNVLPHRSLNRKVSCGT